MIRPTDLVAEEEGAWTLHNSSGVKPMEVLRVDHLKDDLVVITQGVSGQPALNTTVSGAANSGYVGIRRKER